MTMTMRYSAESATPRAQHLARIRRLDGVGLGAPARHRSPAAQHEADPHGQHDDRELRLPEHPAQHRPVEHGAEAIAAEGRHRAEQNGSPRSTIAV